LQSHWTPFSNGVTSSCEDVTFDLRIPVSDLRLNNKSDGRLY
jgi:hypothetical protein